LALDQVLVLVQPLGELSVDPAEWVAPVLAREGADGGPLMLTRKCEDKLVARELGRHDGDDLGVMIVQLIHG